MSNVDNALVRELRRRTGVGILKCKQALIKTKGDINLAIDNIRKSGLKICLNKSSRLTPSGLIAVKVESNNTIGFIIEINCETDFVARSDIFQKFADAILDIALQESIVNINILKTRFETQRLELINKVGENIKIHRFSVLTGDFISSYVHNSKIGVILSVECEKKINEKIFKHIAMHIAAKNPKYIDLNDISKEVMIKERRIQTDIVMRTGKSQKNSEKIIEGRIDKLMSEIVLTKQDFIMDVNKTVDSVLNEYCVKVRNFIRFEMGDDN